MRGPGSRDPLRADDGDDDDDDDDGDDDGDKLRFDSLLSSSRQRVEVLSIWPGNRAALEIGGRLASLYIHLNVEMRAGCSFLHSPSV